MNTERTYDVLIIGGGLAGLAVSILLSRQGHKVALFEKERYPFHRVCGEYISMESKPFLESLGLPIDEMGLPEIHKLQVSAPDGTILEAPLTLGGFGISRYTLDNRLKQIAVEAGVDCFENGKVEEVIMTGETVSLQTRIGTFSGKVCCGTFGKRSNLDIKWNRPFTRKQHGKLNNLVGVKYHIACDHPADTIALHNFRNGYCGISKIEDNKYCLCYLTDAQNLKKHGSIAGMEKYILSRNPHLGSLFANSRFLFPEPVTISQISFAPKSPVEGHLLMLGDAAGMITPLCGNGMSMALHSAKIAAGLIDVYLRKEISREAMEIQYARSWKKHFASRVRMGRWLQRLFGKEWLTGLFIRLMRSSPGITRFIIRQTHGRPY